RRGRMRRSISGIARKRKNPCATHHSHNPGRRQWVSLRSLALRTSRQSMSAVIKLSSPATREFWEIPVLFEDDHLLALDKPAGLLTSPEGEDTERPNLMKLLHAGITEAKPWARERGLTYLMNAHRLDFDTSGVALLAKNKPAFIALGNLFGADKPVRKYLA